MNEIAKCTLCEKWSESTKLTPVLCVMLCETNAPEPSGNTSVQLNISTKLVSDDLSAAVTVITNGTTHEICCPHCQAQISVSEVDNCAPRVHKPRKADNIQEGVFDEKKIYDSNEAAAALGISRSTLFEIRKAGLIRFAIKRASGRAVYTGRQLSQYYNHSSIINA